MGGVNTLYARYGDIMLSSQHLGGREKNAGA